MVCLMFERAVGMDLSDEINAGQKVVILYGPRQVGKTTLPKYKGPFTGTRAYLSTRPNVFPRLGSI